MKKFNNTPNPTYHTEHGTKWDSRACAVVAHVWIKHVVDNQITYYVLVGKRGTGGDNVGKLNIPCGYLDWDENLCQAAFRELYEETGFDLEQYQDYVLQQDIYQPWYVGSSVTENRQNISLHTGSLLEIIDQPLPELSLDHMEPDEVESVSWMKIQDIIDSDSDDWAFNHRDKVYQYLCHYQHDISNDIIELSRIFLITKKDSI